MRRRDRNPAERLRLAVQALPNATRDAMLRGIAANPIIVGAYVDRDSGGICPMLAAHRNGGRTNLASFARAWDRYTGAKHPRLATRREVRTLRSLLEGSLAEDVSDGGSIAAAAAQIRAERAELAKRQAACTQAEQPTVPEPADIPIRIRRLGRPWSRRARRYDGIPDLLAAAEAQLTEQETVRS
jgi:hypothetical protein